MAERDYRKYKGGGRRKGSSSWVSTGPALSEYEQTLANNPGPVDGRPWVLKVLNSFFGGGNPKEGVQEVVERGEDSPVVGPAIGALGRGFDILSRGNYASANVAKELLPENTDDDQGFLEQLKSLWQTGAAIPVGLAWPDFISRELGLRREGVSGGDLARAAWAGLSGKEKTTYGQVLREQGVENNILQGGGGFALDVLLDPTTYVGTGVVKGATKGDDVIKQVGRQIGAPPGSGFNELMDVPPPRVSPPVPDISEVPVDVRRLTHGPPTPENRLFNVGDTSVTDVGLQSAYPRPEVPRYFEPQNPLGPRTVPPVEEVVDSGIPEQFLQGELRFPSSIEMDPIQASQQINLFDKRRKGVKEALEGVDIGKPGKARPVDELSSAIDEAARMGEGSTPMGQLAMQFPEKAEEIKLLQLFDPDMPQHIKKSWKPSVGVDLKIDPPEPWEIDSLINMPARAASDDWEVARQLYTPDGPVNIPINQLAVDRAQGFLKAPYEVPGIKGEVFDGLPKHRDFAKAANEVPESGVFNLDDLNKPWSKPGSGGRGPKGPGFNPGKLPGAGSAASKTDGYVALRLAGVDIVRSHGAYKMGRSVLRPFFYGSGSARLLGKAFNMGAWLPDGTDQMLRVAENTQMAHFDRNMRAVTNHLGKLPLEERRQIGRALADGENLTEFVPKVKTDAFQSAEDYRQLAKGIFDEAWKAEDLQGIAKGPYVDNYFHRQILHEDRLSKEQIKFAKAKNSDGSYKHTVQELIDKGVEIELDVNKVLVDRMAESARKLTRADFQWQAVARFGVPAKHVTPEMAKKLDLVPLEASITGKEFKGKIYVPKHINEAMNWTARMLESDEVSNKMMRGLDRVIGEWKYLALATPGRHVRDTIGDIIMNMQAGVFNPMSYRKASKVLGFNVPSRNNVAKLDEAFVMSKVMGEKIAPDLAEVSIAGQRVPIEKVWEELYVKSGAKAGQLSTEISRLAALPKGRGEVLGGAGNIPGRMYAATKRTIGRASDAREDWARLAHVIDYVDRKAVRGRDVFGPGGDLTSYGKQLVDEAGKSVRKWNIDYGNLTPFERNVVRRAIPFYTFMRHNIPRQLELLFTKPGFMALYPKGNNLMQGVFGTESGDDTLLPNWIREAAPFRVQLDKQEQKGALGWLLNRFGIEPGQQALADPHAFTTPIGDFARLNSLFDSQDPLKATAQEFGSMLSPLFKIPAEIMTGNKIFNGAPIDGDYVNYFAGQLPQGRAAANVFGGRGEENLARMLTGIPLRGISEGQMNNEAYRRELEAKRLFQDSLARNLPAQYRIPRTGDAQQDQQAAQREREIYRNLMRAQESGN